MTDNYHSPIMFTNDQQYSKESLEKSSGMLMTQPPDWSTSLDLTITENENIEKTLSVSSSPTTNLDFGDGTKSKIGDTHGFMKKEGFCSESRNLKRKRSEPEAAVEDEEESGEEIDSDEEMLSSVNWEWDLSSGRLIRTGRKKRLSMKEGFKKARSSLKQHWDPAEAYALGKMIENGNARLSKNATKYLGRFYRRAVMNVYRFNREDDGRIAAMTATQYFHMPAQQIYADSSNPEQQN